MKDSYVFPYGSKLGDVWSTGRLERVPRLGLRAFLTTVFSMAKEASCVTVEVITTEDLMEDVRHICGAEFKQIFIDPLSRTRRFVIMHKALPPPERTKQQIADTYVGMPKASDPIHRVSRLELPQYNRQRDDLEW